MSEALLEVPPLRAIDAADHPSACWEAERLVVHEHAS